MFWLFMKQNALGYNLMKIKNETYILKRVVDFKLAAFFVDQDLHFLKDSILQNNDLFKLYTY